MADQKTTIPKGWKMTTLGEVAFPVSDTFNFSNKDKVHFLNTGDILEGKLLHNDLSMVKTLPGQAKKSFKINDILYSEIRPANKRYMLVDFDSSNSVASTKLMVLRTKENIDVGYVYKLITYSDTLKEFQIIAEARSGTFPQITFDSISNFPLFLPPLPEQRAIAAVLSSLDDKIELLREQNKTLEAIAQAIFKEWFVKFNFPDKNGKPYRDSGGKMIESELGEIPEGWRVGRLGDVTNIVYGKNLPTENLKNVGYPVFGANGQVGFYDKFLYKNQQVLVSCRGEASGKVNISLPNSFITNNSLVLEIPKNSNLNFSFLKGFSLNTDYRIYVSGSAQPQITIETIKHCPILIPDNKTLAEFDNLSQPINKKVLSNSSQIQTLSALRDTLLPKLMKGEIRVEGFKK